MSSKKTPSVEPIRRSVSVSWPQAEAYRRFVQDFAKWWPSYSYSIGGSRVKRVVFEPRAGGRIYEEHKDGTRMRWGTVIALEPPRRVAFTFHPSRAESDAQLVEITFAPEGEGTRRSDLDRLGEDERQGSRDPRRISAGLGDWSSTDSPAASGPSCSFSRLCPSGSLSSASAGSSSESLGKMED